jgi:hypothetical protein
MIRRLEAWEYGSTTRKTMRVPAVACPRTKEQVSEGTAGNQFINKVET